MLYIYGCEDKLTDHELAKKEISDVIETKIDELCKEMSTNTVSESMVEVVKELVFQWTLPDDRAKMIGEPEKIKWYDPKVKPSKAEFRMEFMFKPPEGISVDLTKMGIEVRRPVHHLATPIEY